MSWNTTVDEQHRRASEDYEKRRAEMQRQWQQAMNKFGHTQSQPQHNPFPSRPPRPDMGRPPLQGPFRSGPGWSERADQQHQAALQRWLGIRRQQQYDYTSKLRQREHLKGKPDKKKRGNDGPSIPSVPHQSRHNLLSIAQALNL